MSKAFRLNFDVKDGEITLRSAVKVAMRLPRSATRRSVDTDIADAYIELRDASRKAIARVRAPQLTHPHLEYPTGDPDQPLAHADVSHLPMSYTVLVPADEPSDYIALIEPQAAAAKKAGEATSGSARRVLLEIRTGDIEEIKQ